MNKDLATLPYVLCDCDGTITMKLNDILPATVDNILNYQKKSKNRFTFITGRLDIVNKQLVDQLKVTLPIVSCNGALISDPKTWKVLHAEYLDKDAVINIVRKGEEFGLQIAIFAPGAIVGLKSSQRVQQWVGYRSGLAKKYDFEVKTYDTLTQLIEDIADQKVKPLELIIVAETKKQIKDMHTTLDALQEVVDYSQSLPILFNVTKKGVNKASGLREWAKIVNTNPEDVVVFGDNHNDLKMFEVAKHSYAVGNAVNELKKVSFQVVEKMADDGVGKKLRGIIENEY